MSAVTLKRRAAATDAQDGTWCPAGEPAAGDLSPGGREADTERSGGVVDRTGRRGLDLRWRARPEAAAARAARGPDATSHAATASERPAPAGPSDAESHAALTATLDATRALLWIETPAEAATLAASLVQMLGGSLRPAGGAAAALLDMDVSFGVGEPMLPVAAAGTAPRVLLERHLPAFVRDTHRALELSDRTTQLAAQAAIDPLTGVGNRRTLARALGRLRPDDTVIVIDLDHFKTVNDSLGHDEGDRVLRALGYALRESVRASDRVGRYGGEEFVAILSGGEADPFLQRFQREWVARRPHPVTFSAGVAPAWPEPDRALKAADRAMYRAKLAGRDRWLWATEDEYR